MNDLELVCHGLGLDERHEEPWRNHFVTAPGASPDWLAMLRLEAAGLVERVRTPGFLPADDVVFRATEKGKRAALDHREAERRKAPRLSRSQARYRRFLDADGCYGSFREWLAHETWKARRRRGEVDA